MIWLVAVAAAVAQDDAASKEREAVAAIEKFKSTFDQAKDADVRASAVAALAAVEHAKVLKVLVSCLSTGELEVRRAAAKGLGGWSAMKPDVARALVAAMSVPANAKEPDVIADLLDGIGNAGVKTTAPAILAKLDDTNIPVTSAALRAAAKVRTKEMVDPLIKLLESVEQDLSAPGTIEDAIGQKRRMAQKPLVLAALKSITKQGFAKCADWWAWWRDNKAKFKVEE